MKTYSLMISTVLFGLVAGYLAAFIPAVAKSFGKAVAGGGLAGAVIGLVHGLIYNPPYPGIYFYTGDRAGLTFASWVFFGVIGGVFGSGGAVFLAARKYSRREEGSREGN
jgi:hypothetical protein